MDQVEEIKNKIDVVELVAEYVQIKKAGRNWKGLCPFHGEKTPSFMVNPELQIYKCFGCGEGGDVYAFLQKMEGMDFGEALQTLAKRAGVTLVSYKPTQAEETREKLMKINGLAGEYFHFLLTKHKLGQEAGEYLRKRGITDEAIERFKLGYAPDGWDFLMKYLNAKKGFRMDELQKSGLVVEGRNYDRFRNRVMFPLNNHRGQTVGFAGRVLPPSAKASDGQASQVDQQAKYVNTPETEVYHKGELLYGLDLNKTEIKTAGTAVVVEGEIDAIASWLAGVKNTVAIKGSALTLKQVEILRRFCDTLVLGLDADAAGDMAARRGIEIAQKEGMIIKVVNSIAREVNPKGYKDPGEWGISDPEGWKKAVDEAIPVYDFYIESVVGRHGLDVVGKTRIGRELMPILAGIDDEIVKSHYVKKLAGILGVEDQAVWEQIKKVAPESRRAGEYKSRSVLPAGGEPVRSRREIVEEYLVGLAVRAGKIDQLIGLPIDKYFITPFWAKAVKELAEKKDTKKLPEELKKRVEELALVDEEWDEAAWEKEWKKQVEILELVGVEEGISNLKEKTDEAGVAERIKELVARKGELTRGR